MCLFPTQNHEPREVPRTRILRLSIWIGHRFQQGLQAKPFRCERLYVLLERPMHVRCAKVGTAIRYHKGRLDKNLLVVTKPRFGVVPPISRPEPWVDQGGNEYRPSVQQATKSAREPRKVRHGHQRHHCHGGCNSATGELPCRHF
jgi:hypothetical protein